MGVNPKKLPTGPRGCSMPNFVEIHPVASKSEQTDRQTNKQTDSHLSYKYRYILTGCGPLRGPKKTVRWPVDWHCSPRPTHWKVCKFEKKQKMRKRCRKRIPSSILGHIRKVRIFEFSQNYTPPEEGSPQKSVSRLLSDTTGKSMPNLVEIHPVVWAPNPNKQTDKQTNTFLR